MKSNLKSEQIDSNLEAGGLISKMSLIREKWDSLTIYFGISLLNLSISTLLSATSQLNWVINSSLMAFDIGPITTVASGLLSVLFIPGFAALSDIYGRGPILAGSLILASIGSLIQGSAPNFGIFSCGSVIYGLGNSGINLIISILLADFLKPKNRGFGFILSWFPDIIAVGSSIPVIKAAQLNENWRWLFHSQGIALIVTGIPILYSLLKLQFKAKKLIPNFCYKTYNLKKIDLIGILLLTLGFGGILIPFNLVVRVVNGWANPSIFTPIIIGTIILFLLIIWEVKFSNNPLFNRKLLNRPGVIVIVVHGFNIFTLSFCLDYMNSYLTLTRGITQDHASKIYLGFRIAWFVGGAIAAFLISYYKKPRIIICSGLFITSIGTGLTISSRYPTSPEWFIILGEAVMGLGTGIAACTGPVIIQSTVKICEIATITSLDSLLANIFGIAATALTNTIWNSVTIGNLKTELPQDYHKEIPNLLADLTQFDLLPLKFKSNWILALGRTQLIMCTVSTTFSVICFLISLTIPSINLETCQQLGEEDEVRIELKTNV